jgi:hypothetical protein
MRRAVLAVGSVCVVALMSSAVAQQRPTPDYLLDVASRGPVPLDESTSPAGARTGSGGGDSRARTAGDVEISLVRLDAAPPFEWGEHFVYEVLVENVGRDVVMLPWSPDRNVYALGRSGLAIDVLKGSVVLEVYSADGVTPLAKLEPQLLGGSDALGGTVQPLRPGETAVLRLPGRWRSIDSGGAERVLAQPEGQVTLKARLTLERENLVAESEAGQAVRVLTGR